MAAHKGKGYGKVAGKGARQGKGNTDGGTQRGPIGRGGYGKTNPDVPKSTDSSYGYGGKK